LREVSVSDRFEELRRTFDEGDRQPYDHDVHEESSEDVLSALVEPDEVEAVEEEEGPAVVDEPEAEADARSVGVVVSRFNGDITTRLLAHALTALEEHGVGRDAITVVPVPGAFELPLAAMALAKTRRFACVVALGCVIRGETAHFDYVAGEAASGLQLAALETGVPVAFGVLTCETVEQAEARVERGAEVARGALEMADLFGQMRAQAS
jgi:6,7-dimethyl-8-ribityllumazine synthase